MTDNKPNKASSKQNLKEAQAIVQPGSGDEEPLTDEELAGIAGGLQIPKDDTHILKGPEGPFPIYAKGVMGN
jgi:hypothetical protein